MAIEAIAEWKTLCAANPQSAEAFYGLGLAYLAATQFAPAQTAFQRAIALDGTRPEFYQAQANCYTAQYQYDNALHALDASEKLQPNTPNIFFQRGKIYVRLGKTDDALKNFDRARSMGYQPIECDFERGLIFSKTGRYKESVEAFGNVLVHNPTHAGARFARAQVRRRLGDPQGAAADLAAYEAIRAQEKEADALKDALLRITDKTERARIWSNLGRTYLQQGDPAQAKQVYEAALTIDPSLALAYVGLGASAAALGDFAQAITASQAALRQDPQLVEAQALLGEIAYRKGEWKRATEILTAALTRRPTLLTARRTLAEALLMQKDKRALAEFQTVLNQDPNDAYAHDGLARADAQLNNDLKKALVHARRAVELAPTIPMFQNTRALIAFRLKNLDEAETALRAALDLNPNNPNYRAGLEAVLKARGGK
jgi:tetratricopeptide (TPR) repeat protein